MSSGIVPPRHSRRTALRELLRLAVGSATLSLTGCSATVPRLPFQPTPALPRLTVVVADAYTHVTGDPKQFSGLQMAADVAIPRWVTAAQGTLQGNIDLGVRVIDAVHGSIWQDATLNTASGSGSSTEQPLYLASHATLRRLQAGHVLADLGALLAREPGLSARLSADSLASLRWDGAQAGLPVALWPQLAATDARLPAPSANWSWDAAAAIPAGTGNWPVQLFPLLPTMEAWLWPHQADLLTADGKNTLIDQPAGVAACSAYANAFTASPALSPIPGGSKPAALGVLDADQAKAYNAWVDTALQMREQQIQGRKVGAWFPADEWPPSAPSPHTWRDTVGTLQRLPPPGAASTGLPIIAYGLGVRGDAASPDSLWQAARALQEAAPASLAYSPFLADQTAAGLRKHWSDLTDAQATALAAIFTFRQRPVWGVPATWPPVQFGPPSDVATPTYWQRRVSAVDGGGQDFSRVLTELIGSFSAVLALGLLSPPQAAANMALAPRPLLAYWSPPAS